MTNKSLLSTQPWKILKKQKIKKAEKYEIAPLYFFNHDKNKANCSMEIRNAQTHHSAMNHVVYKTLQDVPKDEEMLVSYGERFENYLQGKGKRNNAVPFVPQSKFEDFLEVEKNEKFIAQQKALWEKLSRPNGIAKKPKKEIQTKSGRTVKLNAISRI